MAPVWQVGDEWQYSYKGPSDSGTYVWSVNRIESLDGITHYVIKSGTREILYRVSDLAFSLERVDGVVVTRERPSRLSYVWPLTVGKLWEQSTVRETPVDRQTINRESLFTVDAEETITVPAGTFRTLKIVWRNKNTSALINEIGMPLTSNCGSRFAKFSRTGFGNASCSVSRSNKRNRPRRPPNQM